MQAELRAVRRALVKYRLGRSRSGLSRGIRLRGDGMDSVPGSAGGDDEVRLVARGIATAVAPESGITDVQAALLAAIASALTGVEVDYRVLEPLGPEDLADVL